MGIRGRKQVVRGRQTDLNQVVVELGGRGIVIAIIAHGVRGVRVREAHSTGRLDEDHVGDLKWFLFILIFNI